MLTTNSSTQDQAVFPDWVKLDLPKDRVTLELLQQARSEMLLALNNFYVHSRHIVVFWISAFALVLAFSNIEIKGFDGYTKIFSAAILFLLALYTLAIQKVVELNYRVYVSTLIYAVKLHVAAQHQDAHPWISRTLRQMARFKSCSEEEFIDARTQTREDAFSVYKRMLGFMMIIAFGFATYFALSFAFPSISFEKLTFPFELPI